MTSTADNGVSRMGDIWALLYYYLAKEMCDRFGLEGEAALRRGIRKYGKERGRTMRAKHLYEGRPINLESLFGHYDLPKDDRTSRRTHILNDEERISETLTCQFSDLWLSFPDGERIGGIYCEEVHHAIFEAYDEAVQVNLTQTLTRGDDVCRFAVYLRRANQLGRDQVVQRHVPIEEETAPVTHITDLFILLYHYMAGEMVSTFGLEGERALRRAIRAFGNDRGRRMRADHDAQGLPINVETLYRFRDRPGDPRSDSETLVLTPSERITHVYSCPFYEGWRDRGGNDVGLIYCQEVHHAMWEEWDDRITVELPETLTAGDGRCVFRVTMSGDVPDSPQ